MLSSASKYPIVFDLDDTLYPEREYFQSGLNVASTMLDPELRDAFVAESGRLIYEEGQRGVRNILTLGLGPNCRDVDLIDAMERAYRGHVPSIRFRPGMLGLIEFLYDRAVLAIISDGRHGEQRRKWRALDIDNLFARVVFADSFGREFWKPSPRYFEELQSELSISAERCFYIGHNLEKDFAAPCALGWRPVHFTAPQQLHSNKKVISAEFAVDSVEELSA